MEQENKELPIQCYYFPSIREVCNDAVLEVSHYQKHEILVHCENARALEFMGDKVNLIIDAYKNVLYIGPNRDNTSWQDLAKQPPLWLATYKNEVIELLFTGNQSSHQKLKDKLLAFIKETAAINTEEKLESIKIKGSFSYEQGGFCFPLKGDNAEIVKDDGYEEFRKYASDGKYYRIKITDVPYYFNPSDRQGIYTKAKDLCQIIQGDAGWPDVVIGQVAPELDWTRFKEDQGNYLFIKAWDYRHGEKIAQTVLDYCDAKYRDYKSV